MRCAPGLNLKLDAILTGRLNHRRGRALQVGDGDAFGFHQLGQPSAQLVDLGVCEQGRR